MAKLERATSSSSDDIREDPAKLPFTRPVRWILLTGNRLIVAISLLLVILGLITILDLWVNGIRVGTPLLYLFGGFIGGNLTLITVVLTINQLVLSRQLRSPGELRTQIQQVKAYRTEIEERADAGIAPPMPAAFLAFLLQSTRQQAHELEEMNTDPERQQLQIDIEELVTPIIEQIDQILNRIDDPELGIFEVLLPLLMTNYAEAIYDARQIQHTYQEALSNETTTTISGLIEYLEQIDVARQYFKTVYIQQELAVLSRFILYVGIPAELATVAMLLLFLQPASAAVALQLPSVLIVIAIAVGFAPLAILVTFVLRIATVAYRTAAITPFTTPGQES